MPQNRGAADDCSLRVDPPQLPQESTVARPPFHGPGTVIVLFHIILRMGIVLAHRHHHYLRRVGFEIPRHRRAEDRVVAQLVPGGLHADGLRLIEPARAVQQGDPALGDVVYLGIQLPGCHPGVGVPAVGIFPIVDRVRFPHVFHSLRHFSRGHGIAVHLHSSLRVLSGGKQAFPLPNLQPQKDQLVAGILALEQQEFMFSATFYRNFAFRRPVLRKPQEGLLSVQKISQVIVPVGMAVLHMHLQHLAGKPGRHAGTGKDEHRGTSVAPVDSAAVDQQGIVRCYSHFVFLP